MNILRNIGRILVAIWNILCGVSSATWNQTHDTCAAIITFSIICMISIFAALIFGIAFDLTIFVVAAAVFSSILFLFTWKASGLFVSVLAGIFKKESLAIKELEKLLNPLVIFSLGAALIATVTAIKGTGNLTLFDFTVWTTSVLFLAILYWAYLGSTRKIAGWVMLALFVWNISAYYVFPLQIQGLLDYSWAKSTKYANSKVSETKDDDLLYVPKNIPFYRLERGELKIIGNSEKPLKAKVIGRKTAPNSKEVLFEVILPVRENLFIGGDNVLVPARLVQPVKAPVKTDYKEMSIDQLHFRLAKIGSQKITVPPGGLVGWIEIPLGQGWYLKSPPGATRNIDFDIITYGEKYFEKGVLGVNYPNQKMAFAIKANRLNEEDITFELEVGPNVRPKV